VQFNEQQAYNTVTFVVVRGAGGQRKSKSPRICQVNMNVGRGGKEKLEKFKYLGRFYDRLAFSLTGLYLFPFFLTIWGGVPPRGGNIFQIFFA